MDNNPFDYTSLADIETQARIRRAEEVGRLFKLLVKFVFHKLSQLTNFLVDAQEYSAKSYEMISTTRSK